MRTNTHRTKEQGIALLLTLVTVTAIISIGLSILTISTKQVRLASIASESEVAFSAANAGLECGLYWRREATESVRQETGQTFQAECFNQSSVNVIVNQNVSGAARVPTNIGGGNAYYYEYQFDWGDPERCSKISMVVANGVGGQVEVTNMASLVPGYPSGNMTCAEDLRCTVMSAQGFNKSCSDITTTGTVQREVLLEL